MRISDWSSDVCSSDLGDGLAAARHQAAVLGDHQEQLLDHQRLGVRVGRHVVAEEHREVELAKPHELADVAAHALHHVQQDARIALADAAYQRQADGCHRGGGRSEEHTSELQSLMRISYAGFCLKKKKHDTYTTLS